MTFETKFRNFVGHLKKKKLTPIEQKIWADELLRLYNEERRVIIDGWHGKSSFDFEEVGDNIIVTKYQKPERGAEPKKINTTISLLELGVVKNAINFIWERSGNSTYIKSKSIAEVVYTCSWNEIFNNRRRHNKFTIILNVLEKKGIIEYRGGRVRLLK